MHEHTLVLVKPDGVQRALSGEILARFERVGLKIIALKMLRATRDQADRHYTLTEEWMLGVFTKASAKYQEEGKPFPHSDHKAYGKFVKDGLVEFLASAPIIAIVLEGEYAVSIVRKLVGATEPASSPAGTIRGDFAFDTYALSNEQNRPIRNLIHASGTVEEAKHEIGVWFTPTELQSYVSATDPIQYDETRFR